MSWPPPASSSIPRSLFDVMVKRLHEYKRQFLKLLHVVTVYNRIKADPAAAVTPCTVIFGAKAAPGYWQAKRIIKLINSVAAVVNADPDVAGRIKVVFIPDYNVSVSELVVAAGNLSEQISLAGKEASGTGNMKLALNGALTVGTLDGANIEIRDRVGTGNFFLFGLTADQAVALRHDGYSPRAACEGDAELKAAIDALTSGAFSGGDRDAVELVLSSILELGRVPGPGRLPVLHRLPRPGRRARLGRPGPVDPDVDPEHGPLGFLLLRPHRPRLQPRHLAHRPRTRTPVPGGRRSTSRPECLTGDRAGDTRPAETRRQP